jgi:hypothetical protein
MFVTHRFHHAGVLKTERPVYSQRALVGAVTDNRDDLAKASGFGLRHRFLQQRLTDAASGLLRVEIDRVFQREAVGITRTIRREIAVTQHLILLLSHQPVTAALMHVIDAPQHFTLRRRFRFEGCGAVQHVPGVNLLYRRRVMRLRGNNVHMFLLFCQ